MLLAEYRGLTVVQLADLRKQLKAVSAEYKIVKNRLARLALKDSSLSSLSANLKGPTGLVMARAIRSAWPRRSPTSPRPTRR
jgi:large subunit ribosomal protein L10